MILGRAVLGTLTAVLGAIGPQGQLASTGDAEATPSGVGIVVSVGQAVASSPSGYLAAGSIPRYVSQPKPKEAPQSVSVSAVAYPSGVGIRVRVGRVRASGSAEAPVAGVKMAAVLGTVSASGSGQAIPAGVFAGVDVGKASAWYGRSVMVSASRPQPVVAQVQPVLVASQAAIEPESSHDDAAVDVAWRDLQGTFAEDEDELLLMLGAFE